MSIKSFKEFVTEGTGTSAASNFVAPKDDDREATEYIWVTPEEGLRINTEEYTKNMIKKYLENRG